jgi:hypothetical protein
MDKEVISLYGTLQKIKESILFLFSKWLKIGIASIIGGVVVFGISFLLKPTYLSKLSFVIEEESSSSSGLLGLASTVGLGSLGGTVDIFSTPNIINFLQTRSLVEKALLKPIKTNNKLTFAQAYINEYELDEDWHEYEKLKNIKFKPYEKRENFIYQKDSILRIIFLRLIDRGELLVNSPFEESNIVEIDVNTKNQLFSRFFPESLINVVGKYYIDTKTKKSEKNINILKFQLDSVRNALNLSLVGAASVNDNIFGLNPAMNVKRVPFAKNQIDVQVNTAILAELVKNLELAKLELLNQTPLIEVIDSPTLPLLIDKLKAITAFVLGAFLMCFFTCIYFLLSRAKIKLKEEYEKSLL